MKKLIVAAAAVMALGGLAACTTATPYQPLTKSAAESGGYSEFKVERDRWRVTFKGNSMTSRQTVETYLLYRAAELTVDQGYDWFETVERHTERQSQTYVEPFGPYGYGWRPYWRYHRRGFGSFWANDIDVQTIRQYEASTEIVMHHGPKPADHTRAFDARDVLSSLASKIVKPS
jgi:hypothetical protein